MPRNGVWRDPEFRKLWAGQAISQMGSRISDGGLAFTAIYLLEASPLQMGLLSGAGAAAVILFGLFAGAWADRRRRRPTLIFTDLARAVVLGTIPLAAVLHRLTMAQLYAAAAVTSVLTVAFHVNYQAYLPDLLSRENLVEGNARLAVTTSLAEVAGPGLTGFLVQAISAPMTVLIDAASFLGRRHQSG